jgi:menaquinone-dependent protoporphyrinogen oxidase
MKTAIVYATTHGCTETCAQKLAARLPGDTDRFNLKEKPQISLANYDRILIGGSIHAGRIQGSVRRFASGNLPVLLQKRIGLFICCMEKGEKARQQLDQSFPAGLLEHASAAGLFGGGFDFERMNFLQKAIIKKIAKIDHSVNNIDEQAINRFAEKLAKES